MRRLGCGEISSDCYTYSWCGMEDGTHLIAVVGISTRQLPFRAVVTMVDECIIQGRIKCILHFISLIAVYTHIKVCKAAKKDRSYDKLNSYWTNGPLETHSLS